MQRDMRTTRSRGFTLVELLLVVAVFGLIGSFAMYAQYNSQQKRRDVRRVSNVVELQKALSLYSSQAQGYPTMTGCISGTDLVTTELVAKGLIAAGSGLVDPLNPSNPTNCYFYAGNGSSYTLRYTLEQTSTAGTVGNHLIVP